MSDQLLVVELVIVTTVVEVVLGDRLVVSGKAIGDQRGEDPRRHDDAELVVKAGDRELGGVDNVDVGVAGWLQKSALHKVLQSQQPEQ